MSRIYQKYLNVNTKFRPYIKGQQPSSTDFLVTLPTPVRNVLSMKLKTFNAPNTEYTFNVKENNNSFQIIDVSGGTSVPYTIKVPAGSYLTSQLVYVVNQLLASALGVTDIELDYLTPIATGGLQRFAFKSVNPANPITNYELNFDVHVDNYIFNTFGWKLGFQKSYYSKNTDLAKNPFPGLSCENNTGNVKGTSTYDDATFNSDTYYLADTPIALPNTSPYYLLSINDFLNQSDVTFIEACYPSNNIMDNIFARITTKYADDNNTVYETDVTESYKRVYSGPVTLSKLHIKLYDDNNNIIDLNNADYSFLLELEVKA